MAQALQTWSWCPMAGVTRTTDLVVDTVAYGDGYVHRATRGLNPARPNWQMSFPFTSAAELQAYEDFLVANAATGFWLATPDLAEPVLVTADQWSANIVDRSRSSGIVGTFSATFVRQFNPQPINP